MRRIAQNLAGNVSHLARHGRREEQGLARLRQHRHDLADVVDEAHVEHLVGFVEHEDFELGERQRALIDEIEQPAGRGDEDVDAVLQRRGSAG